jgi:hypothetical protein
MFLEIVGTFATFVVFLQISFGVLPWMWKNVMKPRFFQPVKFTSYGEWAGELRKISRSFAGIFQENKFSIRFEVKI